MLFHQPIKIVPALPTDQEDELIFRLTEKSRPIFNPEQS